MAVVSNIFKQSPLTNFQTLTHQISILADFIHFEQPCKLQAQKQLILRHLSLFPMYFKFQVHLAEVYLKFLPSTANIRGIRKSSVHAHRDQKNLFLQKSHSQTIIPYFTNKYTHL